MKKHERKYGSCGVPAKRCVKQNVLNVSKEMSANCPNKFNKNDQHGMQNDGTDYRVKNRQLTENQLDILEEAYSQWPHPNQDVLIELVTETNIKREEIVSWYEKKNATTVELSFNKLCVIKDAIEKTQANDNSNFVVEVQNLNNTNVKQKNFSSNVDETSLKKRPPYKLSGIEKQEKVQGNGKFGNVKIRPEHEKKKQGAMKCTSSQNVKTSSNESAIKCELCTGFFQSHRELFVHMMSHVPSRIMASLPEGDEERGWCPHCPGPVPVEQVESHMVNFHHEVKMGGISSNLDPKEILEDGFELEDAAAVRNKTDLTMTRVVPNTTKKLEEINKQDQENVASEETDNSHTRKENITENVANKDTDTIDIEADEDTDSGQREERNVTKIEAKKSWVKVCGQEPDLESNIVDLPRIQEQKELVDFKVLTSNAYKTCSCRQGTCLEDSCPCERYRQECQKACACADSCANKGLTEGEGKLLELAKSKVHGTGCFADEDIKEGDLVGEYVGEVISNFDANKRKSKFLFTTGDENFVIDASKFGSYLTRMNHQDKDCGDNCEFRLRRIQGAWRVGIWALRDIFKGEELFADYGKKYGPIQQA